MAGWVSLRDAGRKGGEAVVEAQAGTAAVAVDGAFCDSSGEGVEGVGGVQAGRVSKTLEASGRRDGRTDPLQGTQKAESGADDDDDADVEATVPSARPMAGHHVIHALPLSMLDSHCVSDCVNSPR